MEKQKQEYLEQQGFEITETLERFVQNETLYIKCIKKFPADPNMQKLLQAHAAGDVKDSFAVAHTIKGMSANLGIKKVYDEIRPFVEILRAGNLPPQEDMDRLTKVYQEVCTVIENMES